MFSVKTLIRSFTASYRGGCVRGSCCHSGHVDTAGVEKENSSVAELQALIAPLLRLEAEG